jgi:hypothetical protein
MEACVSRTAAYGCLPYSSKPYYLTEMKVTIKDHQIKRQMTKLCVEIFSLFSLAL